MVRDWAARIWSDRIHRQPTSSKHLGFRHDTEIRNLAKYVAHSGVSLQRHCIQCSLRKSDQQLRDDGRNLSILVLKPSEFCRRVGHSIWRKASPGPEM